jgi:hypothetical protein
MTTYAPTLQRLSPKLTPVTLGAAVSILNPARSGHIRMVFDGALSPNGTAPTLDVGHLESPCDFFMFNNSQGQITVALSIRGPNYEHILENSIAIDPGSTHRWSLPPLFLRENEELFVELDTKSAGDSLWVHTTHAEFRDTDVLTARVPLTTQWQDIIPPPPANKLYSPFVQPMLSSRGYTPILVAGGPVGGVYGTRTRYNGTIYPGLENVNVLSDGFSSPGALGSDGAVPTVLNQGDSYQMQGIEGESGLTLFAYAAWLPVTDDLNTPLAPNLGDFVPPPPP